jgi:hypothetical protein
MRNSGPIRSFVVIAALAVLAAAPVHAASDSCKRDAKQSFKECKADSQETFQAAKDACLNRDHDCVEACRADRYDCRQATGFDDTIAGCNATLAGAKAQCRTDFAAGSPERDACIDQAQVVAFQCRDDAREAAKRPLKQCRKAFRACAKACPAPSAESPADPRQCVHDAKDEYNGAKADCREDFQVAKDACRHKDHTCVEGCRADRETCRQPVEDQLATDVAACNTQRDSAKANCHSLYADGTPELDQCIDNAQVQAFECRDMARETAHPGFVSCRQGFRMCVEACPAP